MRIRLGNVRSVVGLLAACVLASACAASEPLSDNGQSHWLRSCDSDAECNGLSCLCGLCTTVCSEDSECDLHAGGDAVCRSGDVVPKAGSCGSDPAALSLCLPAVLIVREDAMHEDAMVSVALPHDASVIDATIESQVPIETPVRDSAVDAETIVDATLPDAVAPAPSITYPLHVDCDGIETDQFPAGVEHVGSESSVGGLTAIGTAISWADLSGIRYQADPSAEIELLASFADSPFLADTEIIFLLDFPGPEPESLARISLTDHEVVGLEFESVADISAFTVDDDAVYWSSNEGEGDTVTLWRSEREPGETVMLGTATGMRAVSMYVDDDRLYFWDLLGPNADKVQLFRLLKNGSEPAEAIGDPIASLTAFAGDENGRFGIITSGAGPLDPRADDRVVRIDPTDASVATLFETRTAWNMAVDADYIYWIAQDGFKEGLITGALWRGRRDGDGEPIQLAEGYPVGNGVAVSGDSIYFDIGSCGGSEVNLMRMAKPEP